jgi:hypothetical protein
MAQLDLEVALRSANAAVEIMLPRARRVMNRISALPEADLRDLPKFREDFTQDGLAGYIEALEEWVRAPWRARSRKILQDHGVNCDGIPVEILDDSEGVDKTTAAIDHLESTDNPILTVLIASGLVSLWLRDGHTKAQGQLSALDRAKEGFRRLSSSETSDELLAELLRRAAADTEYLPKAETIVKAAVALRELGCVISNESTWDGTLELIVEAHSTVIKLTQLRGKDSTSFAGLLSGKLLSEVQTSLEQKAKTSEDEYKTLELEFNSLCSTGVSLGIQPSVLPSGIPDLRREVERLRRIYHEKLGEDGMRLLAFLQEREEFPHDLTPKQLENGLLALRPSIARAIRGERLDA